MSGETDLRRIIAKIKRIPKLIKETAGACAQSFDQAIKAELAAGHGPGGGAWERKADGGKPLPNAAAGAVTTKAVGTTIVVATQFPYQFHQRGARGGALPIRSVLPSKLTDKLASAIRKPLEEAFERKVRR